jgi:olfactory receptor
MARGNHSVVSEFVFLVLMHSWEIQLLLLVFSSVLYVASVTGNTLIVFPVTFDPHLHSRMYFLPASLSFIDLGACSLTSPKMDL